MPFFIYVPTGTFYVRNKMDFLSTTQIAKAWGVSRKTVTRYAAEGKIAGAYMVGNTWMIPADAGNQEKLENDCDFHFPFYLYWDFFNIKESLTKPEELKLYSSFEKALQGNYDEAYRLAGEALSSTGDIPIRITCLYLMTRCCLYIKKYNLFMKHAFEMEQIFTGDFEHKKEMSLLRIDIECYYKGFDPLLNASFDMEGGSCNELFPMITTMSLYRQILVSMSNKQDLDVTMYEMSLRLFEEKGFIYPSIMLASELAVVFHNKKKYETSFKYAKYAYDLAVKHSGFIMLIDVYSVAPKVFDRALKHYKITADPELVRMTKNLNKSCIGLMYYLKKPKSLFCLINDDYDYIYYAINDYTNKQIAAEKHISENTVSQKYKRLCNSFNASSKKELVTAFLKELSEY